MGMHREWNRLRTIRLWIIPLVLAALLAACTGGTEEGGQTTEAEAGGPSSTAGEAGGPTGSIVAVSTSLAGAGTDILTATAWDHKAYWDEIHDYLVEADADGNIVPSLAESWEVSEDGLTWTFKIREGVLFHDGSELTAEDVAFSLNRVTFDPTSIRDEAGRADRIESIEADGNNLVIVTTSPEPDVPLWYPKWDGGSAGAIYSKANFEAHGTDIFGAEAMGTGPYQLVSMDGEQSADLTAFVNPDRSEWQMSRTPGFKDIRVQAASDNSTRVALIQSGEADLVPLPVSAIEQLEGSGIEQLPVPAASQSVMFCMGFTWNPESPCDDDRVREALSIAIDRQGIADSAYQGFAAPANAYLAGPGAFGNAEDLEAPPYDLERAQQLLADAGFGPDNPLAVNIMVYENDADFPGMPTLAEAIVANYAAIGINATVELNEEQAHKQKLYDLILPGQPGNPVSPVTMWMRGNDNRYYMVGTQWTGDTDEGIQGASIFNAEAYPEQTERLRPVLQQSDLDLQAEMLAEYHRWRSAEWSQIPLLTADALFGVSGKIASWDEQIPGKPILHNLWSLQPAE